jgi:hypothetical protein
MGRSCVRHSRDFLLTVGILVSIPHFSIAQWMQTGGPEGGQILSMAVSGSNIFVSTYGGGVFRSTNNGGSWKAIGSGLPGSDVNCLAVSGGILLAGTQGAGVYRSMDTGATWTPANSGLPQSAWPYRVYSIASIRDGRGGIHIFAVFDEGVYSSNDTGATWTISTLPGFVGSLAQNDSNIIVPGWYRSVDYGATWSSVGLGLGLGYQLTSVVTLGTTVFAGTSGGGVYVSSDNGASWTQRTVGLSSLNVNALAVNGAKIYAGTDVGVFLSSDSGAHWTGLNSGALAKTSVSCLSASSNGASGTSIVAGTSFGVIRSVDNGSWAAANTGLIASRISCLASDSSAAGGTKVYASAVTLWNYQASVLLSKDNGASWVSLDSGLPDVPVTSLIANGENVFAGTDSSMFRLTNSNSWARVSFGTSTQLRFENNISCVAFIGTKLFASTYSGLFESPDTGKTWVYNSQVPDAMSCIAASGSNILGGTSYGTIFRSGDGGMTWAEIDVELSILPNVNAVAVSPNGKGQVTFHAAGAGAYFSTNDGLTWTAENSGLPASVEIYSLATCPNGLGGIFLFAGTWGNGVYYSSDNGASWTALNTGLPSNVNVFTALSLVGTDLYGGTSGDGIWKLSLSNVSVRKGVGSQENQNKPFGISVTSNPSFVSFLLPIKSGVLNIYDIHGRLVTKLSVVNGAAIWRGAGGFGSPVSAGRYFARVAEGEQDLSKAFVLVR